MSPDFFDDEDLEEGLLTDEELHERLATGGKKANYLKLRLGIFDEKHHDILKGETFRVFVFLCSVANCKKEPLHVAEVGIRQTARILGIPRATAGNCFAQLEGRYAERHESGWRIFSSRDIEASGRRATSSAKSTSKRPGDVPRRPGDVPPPSRKRATASGRRATSRSKDAEQKTSEPRKWVDDSRRVYPVGQSASPTANGEISTARTPQAQSPALDPPGQKPTAPNPPERLAEASPNPPAKDPALNQPEREQEALSPPEPLANKPEAMTPAPTKPTFVAYWYDGDETRDHSIRFESRERFREFLAAEARRLQWRRSGEDLRDYVLASLERFTATYAKRDSKGRTRGKRIGPKRLTEELVSWIRQDLAGEAKRHATRFKSHAERVDDSVKRLAENDYEEKWKRREIEDGKPSAALSGLLRER